MIKVQKMSDSRSLHYKGNTKKVYNSLIGDPCYKFSKCTKERYLKIPELAFLFYLAIDSAGHQMRSELNKSRMGKTQRSERLIKLEEGVSSLKQDAADALAM